ncbi:MAG: succinate dehydrogenase assembly factor 2 [Zoogloeaceae bacterium]|jgi:succinate dehydrogenase / fumarate reductase iron-sulfur subunit/antitoxin CptB|nr:succinate dehydrogenase assembly factor 2 [Zoogloeaceae bacterium]
MERAALERLRWRCIRRGLLEVDIALGRFLDEEFGQLSEAEQEVFAVLADSDDLQLWHWISGQAECEDSRLLPLVARLRARQGALKTP